MLQFTVKVKLREHHLTLQNLITKKRHDMRGRKNDKKTQYVKQYGICLE